MRGMRAGPARRRTRLTVVAADEAVARRRLSAAAPDGTPTARCVAAAGGGLMGGNAEGQPQHNEHANFDAGHQGASTEQANNSQPPVIPPPGLTGPPPADLGRGGEVVVESDAAPAGDEGPQSHGAADYDQRHEGTTAEQRHGQEQAEAWRMGDEGSCGKHPKRCAAYFVVVVAAVIAALILLPTMRWTVAVIKWVKRLGPVGGAAFGLVLYVCGAVVPSAPPNTAIVFGAGALFGIAPGVCICAVGYTLGSLIGLLLGRFVCRRRILQWSQRRRLWRLSLRVMNRRPLVFIALCRINGGVVHWCISNWVFGAGMGLGPQQLQRMQRERAQSSPPSSQAEQSQLTKDDRTKNRGAPQFSISQYLLVSAISSVPYNVVVATAGAGLMGGVDDMTGAKPASIVVVHQFKLLLRVLSDRG
jgi:uncharacterized membrane protein YdjX (TVP38/TMEM64 family)